VTTGVESLWWRDVARTGPPVWASPISWDGQGPIVWVSHDRGSRSRLHQELRGDVRVASRAVMTAAWLRVAKAARVSTTRSRLAASDSRWG